MVTTVLLPGTRFFFFFYIYISRICLVGEKPDKELPGIVGARGDTFYRVLSCMTCVFFCFVFFALSQLQGVEGGWPGRREPDDEHSPASYGGG